MFLSPDFLNFLAAIADFYTPLLLAIAVIDTVLYWKKGDKFRGFYLIYFVIAVYGCMFADIYFQLWQAYSLDYSTHTAAALALVVFISMGKSLLVKVALALSLLAYGFLMFVLQYHSWKDMFSTAIVMAILLTPAIIIKKRRALDNQTAQS